MTSISELLSESMSERSGPYRRRLERAIVNATTHEGRMRAVSEAYDKGLLDRDVYTAVAGMEQAGVRAEDEGQFLAKIDKALTESTVRTVTAFKVYWEGTKSRDPNVLFEQLYLEARIDDDEEDEDEIVNDEQSDEEGQAGDEPAKKSKKK